MRNKIDVTKCEAKNDNVLTVLKRLPNRSKGGIILKDENVFKQDPMNPAHYMAEVISAGEDVKQVKKGEFVLFNQIAGSHIFSEGVEIYKVINEIVVSATSKTQEFMIDSIGVIKNKVIVDVKEVLEEQKTKGGIIIPETVNTDSKQKDMLRGTIKVVSDEAANRGYKPGQLVYFPIDMGNTISEIKGDGEYRSIQFQDISFVLNR